jgi:hypothetical protein
MNGHTNGTHDCAQENGSLMNGHHHANAGSPCHSEEVIENKFSERYTLFMEDEKVFKNMTKEHKI